MQTSDLSRRFVMTVCANGTVHIFDKLNGRPESGTLPVFSTNTKEEAEQVRVRHCQLARDNNRIYVLNDRPRDVEDLVRVASLFRTTFETFSKQGEHRQGTVIPFGVSGDGSEATDLEDEHEDPCGEGGSGGDGDAGGEGGSEPIPCVATRECGTSGLVCRNGQCKP